MRLNTILNFRFRKLNALVLAYHFCYRVKIQDLTSYKYQNKLSILAVGVVLMQRTAVRRLGINIRGVANGPGTDDQAKPAARKDKDEEDSGPTSVASEAPMKRVSVPTADALIGIRTPVLEHGFVVLVDYEGNDDAIVQAARVSYGKGTKTVNSDRGLIRYLMRHRHTTPFEMVDLKFLIKMPIYVARQMIRHRTASVNEYSARYSIMPDEFDVPEASRVKAQSKSNKQGRAGDLPPETVEWFRQGVNKLSKDAYKFYEEALEKNVAKELARIVLGVNVYTQWYWKINLHNLFHFLGLRLDPHAQYEIRAFANAMVPAVKAVAPIAYEAFEDFALNGQSFSRRERIAVKAMLSGSSFQEACAKAKIPLTREDGTPLKSGEGVEFMAKMTELQSLPSYA